MKGSELTRARLPHDPHFSVTHWATRSDLWLFLVTLISVFAVFFATADRNLPYHIDPFTNVISAATIGTEGTPILSDYSDLAESDRFAVFGWVVESPQGPVSQYPPGTAFLAAPLYRWFAADGPTLSISAFNDPEAEPLELVVPPLWPAALIASLTSALAVAFTVLTVRTATRSTSWALSSGLILAFGTGLWLNGAYQLWQHGPASMWIAAALWAASKSRWITSGLLAGLGVLTRPPVAIISAGIGIVASIRSRSWAPVFRHGGGALVGVGALLAYNYWLFDTLTVSGGYGSAFTDRLVDANLSWYVTNLAGAFFSVDRGLFVWSPIVGIALLGVPFIWRRSPAWAVGGLIGGATLLLVQFRLNRYSGGDGFFTYRYPLEAVTASVPMLSIAAQYLWRETRLRLLVVPAAVASVGFHLLVLTRELAT